MGLQPSGGAVDSDKQMSLTHMENTDLPLQIKRLHSLQVNGVLIAAQTHKIILSQLQGLQTR